MPTYNDEFYTLTGRFVGCEEGRGASLGLDTGADDGCEALTLTRAVGGFVGGTMVFAGAVTDNAEDIKELG